ncbi:MULTISPECIES: intercellular adhesin biosynthesis polysaccharide N-deacetylase [Staphylococcus]|uniref:intercellular adhesin biosynthesis polysaccharide N-deacetylase n=1 Tax=Staphylococcus TaxID=1279 RepID=UPI0003113534|nr:MULTISPECIES: intercellular adhesin biosynthesis polysaccharide N-deacetylase [Staphylococcus]MBM6506166.1 intercellular adhesin biosynthesis polysaccharide N-deacetylase [Staphylococcus pasteuri]PTU83909.1 intercellular adhesin biosynthesis polysaccharide N-deacetylase [Staphylococcus pasteuri]PTU84567.1 intercellular adhesin biosynthesis polysaccharide N-deacetylase [Staphylococcus pasteuri]QQT19765.1 intercellular adhesin biosynthesis polysaccharide N-deacetylase [Staphylococcus pasteuri]
MGKCSKLIATLLFTSLFFLMIFYDNTSFAKEKKNPLNSKHHENSALALNYHRVRDGNWFEDTLFTISSSKEINDYSVTKKEFNKQIKWLKDHDAHFLTEKEFQHYKSKGKFPARSVWINFDDIDMSVYDSAYPILKKYNVPATGFVITGHVGEDDFHNLNLINLSKLKEMQKSKIWTFSSHTHNLHSLTKDNKSIITKKSGKQIKNDISKSNHYINKNFDKTNNSLAFPYGEPSKKNIKILKSENIKYAYTLADHSVYPDDDNYAIPRVLVNEDSFNKLIKKWDGFKDGKSK